MHAVARLIPCSLAGPRWFGGGVGRRDLRGPVAGPVGASVQATSLAADRTSPAGVGAAAAPVIYRGSFETASRSRRPRVVRRWGKAAAARPPPSGTGAQQGAPLQRRDGGSVRARARREAAPRGRLRPSLRLHFLTDDGRRLLPRHRREYRSCNAKLYNLHDLAPTSVTTPSPAPSRLAAISRSPSFSRVIDRAGTVRAAE